MNTSPHSSLDRFMSGIPCSLIKKKPPIQLGILVLALSFLPTVLQANPATPTATDETLTITTDHPDAIYHVGEKVTFTVRLLKQNKPASEGNLQWKLSKDGVAPFQNGSLDFKNGEAVITGQLEEPGFLQCQITTTLNQKNTSMLASAAIDPLLIKPSLPPPDDFDTFWNAQKAALAKIPINPQLTPVPSEQPDVELFDLHADCVGVSISAYYARPKGAKPKSLPGHLIVQGAGVRSSNAGQATGWAKAGTGTLTVEMNAHGIPNGKPKEFYEALAKGELSDYRIRGRESRETVYFLGMYLRVLRALDFLASQPEWDGQTLIIQGGSQGGAQAMAGAALDPRVTFFAAVVPALCEHSGMKVQRAVGWPKLVPLDASGAPNPQVLETARYFDSVNFATRIQAPGYFGVGFIDLTCPPTTVYSAYNRISTKKEIFNDIKGGHNIDIKVWGEIRRLILEHIASKKIPTNH